MLPNPWDIGTAICLEHLGFKALATTSAGFAFSRSKPDGGVPRDEMLAHIREIVRATALPVNADFHGGYADEPEDVATNVRLCVETGVAGLSIEDSTGRSHSPLYEKKLAIERIRVARPYQNGLVGRAVPARRLQSQKIALSPEQRTVPR